MSTQKVKPDPGAPERQRARRRRLSAAKTVGAFAVVAAIGAVVAVLVLRSVPEERQSQLAAASASVRVARIERPPVRKLSRVVEGVRFSFEAPWRWERGPATRLRDGSGFRNGKLLISRNTVGPQGAEAVVFWTSFPGGDRADACGSLTRPRIGPSAADLAAAVATAPGTKLVKVPSDVTVGAHPAQHVVLTVRKDVGCDPGFFYTWRPRGPRGECWGACWLESSVGDTIRVWIVEVDGTRLFIEAETTKQAGPHLEQEIRQIVESIRFE
jgi:hypothetical protein